MFSPWETSFGSFAAAIGIGATKNGDASSEALEESHLSKLLDDLKTSDQQYEARRSGRLPAPAPAANANNTAEPAEAAPTTDDPLSEAQRLIAQQRKAAESLLSEVCALEERLKLEATAAKALELYHAAAETAKSAASEEHHAKKRLESASQRHDALAAEHKAAQARAEECARAQAAVASEAADAATHHQACQAATLAAQKDADDAKSRADALQNELPAATQGLAGLGDVQALVARISQQASSLPRPTNGNT